MDTLLAFEAAKVGKEGWSGRENFAPQHYPLVDWYHKATGQDCGTKAKLKDWMKAVGLWAANKLTVADLQAAYDMDIKWKGVFKSPNELTKTAEALKAQGNVKPAERSSILRTIS